VTHTIPLSDFWRSKKVLITGITGFKGSWLALFLLRLGANVYGLGLPPTTTPSIFTETSLDKRLSGFKFLDIVDKAELNEFIRRICADAVCHLAADPLVFESY